MYIYIIAVFLAVFATILIILYFANDKKKSAKIARLDDDKWQIMIAYTKTRARYQEKIAHLNNLLAELGKMQQQSFKKRIQNERQKETKTFCKNYNLFKKNQTYGVSPLQNEIFLKEYLKKMEHRKIHTKRIDYTKIITMCLTCDKEKCNGDCEDIKKATKEFFKNRSKIKKETKKQ